MRVVGSPAYIFSRCSKVMGIRMDSNARQLFPPTTDEDSNMNLLEATSMILMMKKVWERIVMSVVSHEVGSSGLRMELISRVSSSKSEVNVSVTMIYVS